MQKAVLTNLILTLILNYQLTESQTSNHVSRFAPPESLKDCPPYLGNIMSRNISEDSSTRSKPEGQSISRNSEANEANLNKRLKTIEEELEQSQKENSELKELLESIKSDSRREEARLLKIQQKLAEDNERLKHEIYTKNDRIDELIEELKSLKQRRPDSPSSLQGEPQLNFGPDQSTSSTDSHASNILQQIGPRIKSYKAMLQDLIKRQRMQKDTINTLNRQLELYRKDFSREKFASSMDSSVSSHTGGPPTSNLTLSFQSANPHDRLLMRPYASRPAAALDSTRHQLYPNNFHDSGSMYSSRLPPRSEPIEHNENVYANEYYKRDNTVPLSLSSESSGMVHEGTLHRKPVPVPRTRSLKSMSASMASVPVAETSIQGNDSSFELVDRPPPATVTPFPPNRTLTVISEQSNSSASNISDQPNILTQNITVPGSTATYGNQMGTRSDFPATYARASDQVCDVCRVHFSQYSQRQFMDHCIECAEKAAEAEETVSFSIRESRVCPVCGEKFPEEISQREYETHVHRHFEEEEARAAGWEPVTGK